MRVRAGLAPRGPPPVRARGDTPYVVEAVRTYAKPGRYVDTSPLRGGENRTAGRRQSVCQPGVETEQPVRMTGPQQHRSPPLGHQRQPLGERVQRGHRPLRIDRVGTTHMRGIGRDPAPLRHQPQQLALAPGPLGREPQHHPRIPGCEQPVAAQTGLARGGHGPGQPGRQQMGAQRPGAQHPWDAAVPRSPAGGNPVTPHRWRNARQNAPAPPGTQVSSPRSGNAAFRDASTAWSSRSAGSYPSSHAFHDGVRPSVIRPGPNCRVRA